MQTAMTTIRNDSQKPATLVTALHRKATINPGEKRTLPLVLAQAEWLAAHAGGLVVLQIRPV